MSAPDYRGESVQRLFHGAALVRRCAVAADELATVLSVEWLADYRLPAERLAALSVLFEKIRGVAAELETISSRVAVHELAPEPTGQVTR